MFSQYLKKSQTIKNPLPDTEKSLEITGISPNTRILVYIVNLNNPFIYQSKLNKRLFYVVCRMLSEQIT